MRKLLIFDLCKNGENVDFGDFNYASVCDLKGIFAMLGE